MPRLSCPSALPAAVLPLTDRSRGARFLVAVGIAAAYYGSAHLGFAFAFQTQQVSAVWPPTGLALAALLVFGVRMWPAVAAGAFVANATAGESLLTAAGITAGNTLEALAAVALLACVRGFRPSLDSARDVTAVAILAAGISTLVSATLGVASLRLGGILPAAATGETWRTWWLGDAAGDLLVAPVLLVAATWWAAGRRVPHPREATVVVPALAVLAAVIFRLQDGPDYALFPLLFLVALRYRQPGATAASLLVAGVGVWATARGHGPYAGAAPDVSLLRVQTFAGVVALTAMLAAAVRTQGSQAEELLAIIEQRVAERTCELSAANRELEAFDSAVSHDLRAPVRAIGTFSQTLLDEYHDRLDERGQDLLGRLHRAGGRMGETIDDLLVLSQTRRPLRPTEVDLSALGHEIVGELRAQHADRDVNVVIEEGLVARGDQGLLRSLLQNLLENAWKYTAPRDHAQIEFTHVGTDGSTAYVVRDNGVGFDMQEADRLFRPFERLHRSDAFAGTGVGLTTVRRVAERHGGRAWAEGRAGDGAAFYFDLHAEHA